MATEKPRFTITLDRDMLSQVLDYKAKNNLSTQSKAIQKLIELGVRDIGKPVPAPVFSPDEVSLLSDHRELSPAGKEYIRQTMALALRSYGGKHDIVSDVEGGAV